MALTAPGMGEKVLFPRAPAGPGVWVSLLESPGCQAALALAHVHTVRSHTRVPRHQGLGTRPTSALLVQNGPHPPKEGSCLRTKTPPPPILVTPLVKGAKELWRRVRARQCLG